MKRFVNVSTNFLFVHRGGSLGKECELQNKDNLRVSMVLCFRKDLLLITMLSFCLKWKYIVNLVWVGKTRRTLLI